MTELEKVKEYLNNNEITFEDIELTTLDVIHIIDNDKFIASVFSDKPSENMLDLASANTLFKFSPPRVEEKLTAEQVINVFEKYFLEKGGQIG